MLRILALVALMAAAANAHLCLMNPHQRGKLVGFETAGTNDCALTAGPCGLIGPQNPFTKVPAGTNYTIAFQKNLNHFNAAKPGQFIVDFSVTPLMKDWTTLATVKDTNSPSLTYYNTQFKMPETKTGHGVLRVRYETSNPSAPATFYQCADLGLI